MKTRFRLGIAGKIGMLTVVLVSLTALSIGYLIRGQGKSILVSHELIDHDDDTHVAAREILADVRALGDDARRLARDPGIVNAVGQLSRAAGADEARWRSTLGSTLDAFLAGNSSPHEPTVGPHDHGSGRSPYAAVRVIGRDGTGRPWEVAVSGDPSRDPRSHHPQDCLDSVAGCGPQEVRLRELKPGENLMADVPIDRVPGGGPAAVLCLELDFDWLTRNLAGNPRGLSFLADRSGNLLFVPSDLGGSTSVTSLYELGLRPARDEGSPEDAPRPPTIDEVLRPAGSRVPLALEDSLRKPGARFALRLVDRPLWLLTIDIERDDEAGLVARTLRDRALPRFGPGRVVYPDGQYPEYHYRYVRGTDPDDLRAIKRLLEGAPELAGRGVTVREPRRLETFVVRTLRLHYDPDHPDRFLALASGVSESEIVSDFDRDMTRVYAAALGVLGASLLGSCVFALMLTSSLRQIKVAAEALPQGRFELPLPTKASDEIGVLARTFEQMKGQLRQKARELRDSLDRTRTILDMAAEGIVALDADGRVETFNKAAERILGYAADEVVGLPGEVLFAATQDGPGPATLSSVISLEMREGQAQAHELTGRRKDGSTFPMEVTLGVACLGECGDRRIFIAIVRDVSERKAIERERARYQHELEECVRRRTAELEDAKADLERSNQELCAARDATIASMQAQAKFYDEVAHDLRTPLAIVLGYSQDLLLKSHQSGREEFYEDLKLVVDKGTELGELIDDLLNVSKVMSGKELPLKVEEFDVAETFRRRLVGIERLAGRNDNTFEPDIPDDLGTMVADEVRVWRIVMNLLTNACKFTQDGHIALSVRRTRSSDGDRLVFRVRDTGLGMSPDQVRRLFQRFQQVHQAQVGKSEGGFGLGLSTCALYCRAMGGTIEVESEPGVGSTFTVSLPAQVGDAALAAGPERPRPRRQAAPAGEEGSLATHPAEVVLIIDDDASVCELMRRAVSDQGLEARTALTGEEGLRLAKQIHPSAIFLDVVLPGIDGWGVLAALKADSETADIPIIMATMVDDPERGLRLGADDYVVKPLVRDRMAELLRKHLGDRAPSRILLVEDEPELRRRLADDLRGEGWDVYEAGDGRCALDLIERHQPDLILLDLMLPRMDGFEVIEAIRQRRIWRQIPIIVITGIDLDAAQKQRLQGRVKQILCKGLFGREELFEEVRLLVREVTSEPATAVIGGDPHA